MFEIIFTRRAQKTTKEFKLDELLAIPRLGKGKSLIRPPKPEQAEFVGIGHITSPGYISKTKYSFFKIIF